MIELSLKQVDVVHVFKQTALSKWWINVMSIMFQQIKVESDTNSDIQMAFHESEITAAVHR